MAGIVARRRRAGNEGFEAADALARSLARARVSLPGNSPTFTMAA
jgi:hypothetical protein